MLKEQNTSVREFLRNYKKLSSSNQIVIISDHGKPKGVYVPYEEWHKERTKKDKKFTLEELKKYCFPGGPPDLSQRIDEVAYPYPNKLKNDNTR